MRHVLQSGRAGCPPLCQPYTVKALNASLETAPSGDPYLALDNIRSWILGYDMSQIPWGQQWNALFSTDTQPLPDSVNLHATITPPINTSVTDSHLPTGTAVYVFQRAQILFTVPTNYLLLAVGWSAATGIYGYYDEGCAGSNGGGCGVMEVPWSVIPGYPFIFLFIQGPTNYDAGIFPDLQTLITNVYGPNSAGPDWNPNQGCGPAHANDPFGDQLSAP
jgi:hypothetical protein